LTALLLSMALHQVLPLQAQVLPLEQALRLAPTERPWNAA
jgi:hypothetical protein